MRWLLLSVLFLSACATAQPRVKLDPGRGIYWDYTETRLENSGYPNTQLDYLSSEWGVLFDEEGLPYGPGTFVRNMSDIGSELVTRDEERNFIQGRWVGMYDTECCDVPLVLHMLEIFDLHYYDLRKLLEFEPEHVIEVYSPASLDEYRAVTGHEFWNAHAVVNGHIILEPAGILFRRKIYGRTCRTAMAQVFLDLKCNGRIPAWLREGLASYLAEEGNDHLSFVNEFRMQGKEVLWAPAEILEHIAPLRDREKGRIARYNAFLMAWHLSETWGYDRIKQLLALVEHGQSFEQACRQIYGVDEAGLLEMLNPKLLGEPTTTLIIPQG